MQPISIIGSSERGGAGKILGDGLFLWLLEVFVIPIQISPRLVAEKVENCRSMRPFYDNDRYSEDDDDQTIIS